MSDLNFDKPKMAYEEMDLSEIVRDDNLYNFVVLNSKYLAKYRYTAWWEGERPIYSSIKKRQCALQTIKEPLIELAKTGYDYAVALYLELEFPELWDKDIVEYAKCLEKMSGAKTPEQWHVVANLHLADRVNCIASNLSHVDNVKKLVGALHDAWAWLEDVRNEYDHGRFYNFEKNIVYGNKEDYVDDVICPAFNMTKWLKSCLDNQAQEYVRAMRQAQVGYYQRYFKNGDIMDANSFLDSKKNGNDMFVDWAMLKQVTNGVSYGSDSFGWFLKKDGVKCVKESRTAYKKGDLFGHGKVFSIEKAMAFASGLELVPGGTGLFDEIRFSKQNRINLQTIGELSLRPIAKKEDKGVCLV